MFLLQSLPLPRTIISIEKWTDSQVKYLYPTTHLSEILSKIFFRLIFKGAGWISVVIYPLGPHIWVPKYCLIMCLYVCMYVCTHSTHVYVRPKLYIVDIVVCKRDKWIPSRWVDEYITAETVGCLPISLLSFILHLNEAILHNWSRKH